MERSIVSVLAGYVSMALIVMVTTMALVVALGVDVGGEVPPVYLVLNLFLGLVAAIVGGWVCARVGRPESAKRVRYLIGLVVLFGLGSLLMNTNKQPMWYGALLIPLGALGIWVGGRVHGSGRAPSVVE